MYYSNVQTTVHSTLAQSTITNLAILTASLAMSSNFSLYKIVF